jgi:hypothetical protein
VFLLTASLATFLGTMKDICGDFFTEFFSVRINLKVRLGDVMSLLCLKSKSIPFLSTLFFLGSILKSATQRAFFCLFDASF